MVALHHQLAHVRREANLDAIVVTDDTGLVVAGAGAWVACEELAAYAPILASARSPGHATWNLPGLEQDSRIAEMRTEVDVRPVNVDGQRLLVCARGGVRGGRTGTGAMQRAADGVARILSC
jgi:hypothetical protein